MTTYHITLNDDRGGFASSAIAEQFEGRVLSTVSAYDGENDLALIEFEDAILPAVDADLDADPNVLRYRVATASEA